MGCRVPYPACPACELEKVRALSFQRKSWLWFTFTRFLGELFKGAHIDHSDGGGQFVRVGKQEWKG